MNANSSLAEDVAIVMPKSTIRTVSLEKLRQPSPLSNHNTSTSRITQTLRIPKINRKRSRKECTKRSSIKRSMVRQIAMRTRIDSK